MWNSFNEGDVLSTKFIQFIKVLFHIPVINQKKFRIYWKPDTEWQNQSTAAKKCKYKRTVHSYKKCFVCIVLNNTWYDVVSYTCRKKDIILYVCYVLYVCMYAHLTKYRYREYEYHNIVLSKFIAICYYSYDLMSACWREQDQERPSFVEISRNIEDLQNGLVSKYTS